MNIIPHPDKISSPWTGEGKVRVKNKISSPPSVIAIPDSYRGKQSTSFPLPWWERIKERGVMIFPLLSKEGLGEVKLSFRTEPARPGRDPESKRIPGYRLLITDYRSLI